MGAASSRQSGRGSRAVSVVVALLALCGSAARADWEDALEGPLSPGSVALLVEHARDRGVQDRWAAALRHARPEVRAAAARVVNVSAATELVPGLQKALSTETDRAAAIEEVRALGTLGGPAAEEPLLEAARRLGGSVVRAVADTLGRVLGPDALRHLAGLRAAGLEAWGYREFVHMATREGTDGLVRAASAALREADPLAWEAVLAQARDADVALEPGVIAASLGLGAPRLRAATYWHLALESARGRAVPGEVLETLGASAESRSRETADVDALFAYEVLKRTQGQSSMENADWLAKARGRSRVYLPFGLLRRDPLVKHLTAAELAAIEDRLPGPLPVELPFSKTEVSSPRAEAPRALLNLPRIATGFPPRFASDLLAVAGCSPRAPYDLTGANVTYGLDGRPRHVEVVDSGLYAKCAKAARALFRSFLPPLGHLTRPERPEIVLAPLDANSLVCLEDPGGVMDAPPPGGAPAGQPVPVGGRIAEPKKVRDALPFYPESAKRSGIQGIVIMEATISTAGCIKDLKVLRGVPGLNVAAMAAVMRWRYTPTLLNGRPVPVIMTVTVNFHLSH